MFLACGEFDGNDAADRRVLREADDILDGSMSMFGLDPVSVGAPPDWHANPFSESRVDNVDQHWSSYGDFSSGIEDIKTIWELSRFSWALILARGYRLSGDIKYLELLNDWTEDWLRQNPYNQGPNWMCGQESSIRLSHVLLADALMRNSGSCTALLHEFVVRHCERIRETMSYAIGQQNNHGTSEAFGLMLGGAWLKRSSSSSSARRSGDAWYRKGRRLLERQVKQLVMNDGTFAQMSMTYQRLFLDTACMAEWWRRYLDLQEFSDTFYARVRSATRWLYNFVDKETGDVPNIGWHDGSVLYPLCTARHRDCRSTVQLAGALFLRSRCFDGDGPWKESLAWLGVVAPDNAEESRRSQVYADGGFAMLRAPGGTSYLACRFPSAHFRPGHADALHVDLWCDGVNILRDGGTYSYAVPDEESQYFVGTSSHNTCQFDGRDQMPRLSRFLFGSWLKTEALSFDSGHDGTSWSAAYTDYRGCHHSRTVSYRAGEWLVVDELSGFEKNAVLRWRVSPDVEWSLHEQGIESTLASLSFSSESDFDRVELCRGWESRFYLRKTALPVLEVELGPGYHRVDTSIRLHPDVS